MWWIGLENRYFYEWCVLAMPMHITWETCGGSTCAQNQRPSFWNNMYPIFTRLLLHYLSIHSCFQRLPIKICIHITNWVLGSSVWPDAIIKCKGRVHEFLVSFDNLSNWAIYVFIFLITLCKSSLRRVSMWVKIDIFIFGWVKIDFMDDKE